MIIQSKRIWVGGQFIEAQIEIIGKKISNILPYNKNEASIDYENRRIIPGFIDVHTHGGYGYGCNDVDKSGLINWLEKLPLEGVTGVLPTTITNSEDTLKKALKNIALVSKMEHSGAQILGIHFEGPYLDFENKGAQPPKYIVKPNLEQFKTYQENAGGLIKYMTMATEHDDGFKLTQYAAKNNVVVSIGHTGSSYSEAVLSIANGASSFTHAFNGMTGLHHRNPNTVGALMRSSDVFAEIIADGRHVHPDVVNLLFKVKPYNMLLITDSLPAKGMAKGEHDLSGTKITIDDFGTAFLKGTNTISGSTLKVNEGLKNLVEKMLIPFDQALNSATLNPARVLRIDHIKGKIQTGYDADIVVLEDDYQVLETFSLGRACIKENQALI